MTKHVRMEAITTDEADRWDETLREVGMFDFYHLAAFHRLAEIRGEGTAVMPVMREGDCVLAMPLLVRDIETTGVVDARAGLKDATSVCGFAGPVASPGTHYEARGRFVPALNDYLEQSGIVSVYQRLNPLTTPPSLLNGHGETLQVGVTISIDLTLPPDVQFSYYRKSHRYEIQRLRKMGFTCEQEGIDHLDDFIRIYEEAMRDLNADHAYLYERDYFHYLMTEMSDSMHLSICRDGGTAACVGLFGYCNGIIQYHLAGTAAEYRRLAPMKLMLDAVRQWGNSIGARVFHLGGGVGARRDSLYDFKMGFGGREHVYSTWRHVVDQQAYDEVCRAAFQSAGMVPEDSFFPAYRSPSLDREVVHAK